MKYGAIWQWMMGLIKYSGHKNINGLNLIKKIKLKIIKKLKLKN